MADLAALHAMYGQDEGEGEGEAGIQVTDVFDAAGNLIREIQEVFVDDPELAPVEETPTPPSQQSVGLPRRAQLWLMDANKDNEVNVGEWKVFGLGALTGAAVAVTGKAAARVAVGAGVLIGGAALASTLLRR